MTQSFFRRWITIVIVILQGVNTCAYANAGDVYSMQCSAGLGVPRDTTAALILSPDSGTVVEQFKGTTQRMVVCIQDVHCNAQAQKKIYEVLTVVTQHYGSAVHRICREGAWGTLDLTLLRDIENFHHPRIRDRVIQQLVRQGRMTGAEQFVFEAQLHGAGKNIDGVASAPSTHKAALQPVQLYGIEDAALYRRNRAALVHALGTRQNAVTALRLIRVQLQRRQKYAYTGMLAAFRHDVQNYERGAYPADAYLVHLSMCAQNVGIAPTSFPTISTYCTQTHPIDYATLLDEERELRFAIAQKLAGTDAVERLVQLEHDVMMLDAFLNNRVSARQAEYVRLYRDAIMHRIETFLQQNTHAIVWHEHVQRMMPDLKNTLHAMYDFYQYAEQRNRVLVTNALRTNDAVVVMVVGGYHTEGITQLLRAKGEGYVVIAPRVTAQDTRGLYEKLLREQAHADGGMTPQSLALMSAFQKGQSSEVSARFQQETIGIIRAHMELFTAEEIKDFFTKIKKIIPRLRIGVKSCKLVFPTGEPLPFCSLGTRNRDSVHASPADERRAAGVDPRAGSSSHRAVGGIDSHCPASWEELNKHYILPRIEENTAIHSARGMMQRMLGITEKAAKEITDGFPRYVGKRDITWYETVSRRQTTDPVSAAVISKGAVFSRYRCTSHFLAALGIFVSTMAPFEYSLLVNGIFAFIQDPDDSVDSVTQYFFRVLPDIGSALVREDIPGARWTYTSKGHTDTLQFVPKGYTTSVLGDYEVESNEFVLLEDMITHSMFLCSFDEIHRQGFGERSLWENTAHFFRIKRIRDTEDGDIAWLCERLHGKGMPVYPGLQECFDRADGARAGHIEMVHMLRQRLGDTTEPITIRPLGRGTYRMVFHITCGTAEFVLKVRTQRTGSTVQRMREQEIGLFDIDIPRLPGLCGESTDHDELLMEYVDGTDFLLKQTDAAVRRNYFYTLGMIFGSTMNEKGEGYYMLDTYVKQNFKNNHAGQVICVDPEYGEMMSFKDAFVLTLYDTYFQRQQGLNRVEWLVAYIQGMYDGLQGDRALRSKLHQNIMAYIVPYLRGPQQYRRATSSKLPEKARRYGYTKPSAEAFTAQEFTSAERLLKILTVTIDVSSDVYRDMLLLDAPTHQRADMVMRMMHSLFGDIHAVKMYRDTSARYFDELKDGVCTSAQKKRLRLYAGERAIEETKAAMDAHIRPVYDALDAFLASSGTKTFETGEALLRAMIDAHTDISQLEQAEAFVQKRVKAAMLRETRERIVDVHGKGIAEAMRTGEEGCVTVNRGDLAPHFLTGHDVQAIARQVASTKRPVAYVVGTDTLTALREDTFTDEEVYTQLQKLVCTGGVCAVQYLSGSGTLVVPQGLMIEQDVVDKVYGIFHEVFPYENRGRLMAYYIHIQMVLAMICTQRFFPEERKRLTPEDMRLRSGVTTDTFQEAIGIKFSDKQMNTLFQLLYAGEMFGFTKCTSIDDVQRCCRQVRQYVTSAEEHPKTFFVDASGGVQEVRTPCLPLVELRFDLAQNKVDVWAGGTADALQQTPVVLDTTLCVDAGTTYAVARGFAALCSRTYKMLGLVHHVFVPRFDRMSDMDATIAGMKQVATAA